MATRLKQFKLQCSCNIR